MSQIIYADVTNEQWKIIEQLGDPNNCRDRVKTAELRSYDLLANSSTRLEVIRDYLAKGKHVKLTAGTYEFKNKLLIYGKAMLSGQDDVIIDFANSSSQTGIELHQGVLSNVIILNAKNNAIELNSNSLIHNLVIKDTGRHSSANSNGSGVRINGRGGRGKNNCLVSIQVSGSFNETGSGPLTVNGGNADGIEIKYGGKNNTLIDIHAFHNSDDGYDFWKGGDGVTFDSNEYFVKIFYSSASANGYANGDGNGFKFGSKDKYQAPLKDKGARFIYGSAACFNLQNGFDKNGSREKVETYNIEARGNQKRSYQGVSNFGPNKKFSDPYRVTCQSGSIKRKLID